MNSPLSQGAEPVAECLEADHDWEFRDDSFDHEFGTERIHYWECVKCFATKGMEAGDYYEDDHDY